jgi:hypothetical protein
LLFPLRERVARAVKSLKARLEELFPKAIFTLDVCHVVEKLWQLGRHFHQEGSASLKEWVEKLKELLYAGRAQTLVKRLQKMLRETAKQGPGTKSRHQALKRVIGYLRPRLAMMRYGVWRALDLVIATGQVEGAVRYLVGERFDCAGMRWIRTKAEALLHLRCIELNDDWQEFVNWFEGQNQTRLKEGERRKVLTNQPMNLKVAA